MPPNWGPSAWWHRTQKTAEGNAIAAKFRRFGMYRQNEMLAVVLLSPYSVPVRLVCRSDLVAVTFCFFCLPSLSCWGVIEERDLPGLR